MIPVKSDRVTLKQAWFICQGFLLLSEGLRPVRFGSLDRCDQRQIGNLKHVTNTDLLLYIVIALSSTPDTYILVCLYRLPDN